MRAFNVGYCAKVERTFPFAFVSPANQRNPLANVSGRIRIGEMETVWGALLSFLFVLALALSGHVETPSKEQVEQMEKAGKEKKEQMEKAEKEKKEQKDKAEPDQKSKQREKSKQKDPDVWQLRQ
jgi:uncharacterized membrane protein YdbT with pleckstrin-like domain